MKQYISESSNSICCSIRDFFLPPDEAYAPRFKSSTFMGVVFAETVRDKST